MIYAENKAVYFAGDTALTYDMKLLAEENLEWAFFYRRAINIPWVLMMAIKASDFINCKNIIGIHYDSFPVIKIDKKEVMDKFIKARLNLKLPAIGGTLNL